MMMKPSIVTFEVKTVKTPEQIADILERIPGVTAATYTVEKQSADCPLCGREYDHKYQKSGTIGSDKISLAEDVCVCRHSDGKTDTYYVHW